VFVDAFRGFWMHSQVIRNLRNSRENSDFPETSPVRYIPPARDYLPPMCLPDVIHKSVNGSSVSFGCKIS
jgi:hypothetical protein